MKRVVRLGQLVFALAMPWAVRAESPPATTAAPLVLPVMKIRGDDIEMTISADPATQRLVAITVDHVSPNSTAARLGLKAGYHVEQIDGVPITQLHYDDVSGDRLTHGQSIRFASERILGLYRRLVTVSFGVKRPSA